MLAVQIEIIPIRTDLPPPPNSFPPSAPYAAFLGSMETPVHLASENGHLPLIEILIDECRVDVDWEQDAECAGALHYACNGRSTTAVAHLLQRHRADPMCYDRDTGETPLTAAAAHGPPAIIRLLLDDGRSDVEAPRKGRRGGQTATLLAAWGKQWASVEMLLDHGVEPTMVWPGRAISLKRTLAEFALADLTCPPELLARIQATAAEGQRAEILHRLRFLSDGSAAASAGASSPASTTASVSNNKASSAAATPPPTTARQTRGATAQRIVKCVPPCLAGRVHRQTPMPRAEMVDPCLGKEGQGGVSAGKRGRGGESSQPQPAGSVEPDEETRPPKRSGSSFRRWQHTWCRAGWLGTM